MDVEFAVVDVEHAVLTAMRDPGRFASGTSPGRSTPGINFWIKKDIILRGSNATQDRPNAEQLC